MIVIMKKEYLKHSFIRELLDIGAVDAADRKIFIGDYLDFTGDGMVGGSRETGRVLINKGVVMVNEWKIFSDNSEGRHNRGVVSLSDSYVIDSEQ